MRATFEMFNKVKVTRSTNQQGIDILGIPYNGESLSIHIDSIDVPDLITALEYLVNEAKMDKFVNNSFAAFNISNPCKGKDHD